MFDLRVKFDTEGAVVVRQIPLGRLRSGYPCWNCWRSWAATWTWSGSVTVRPLAHTRSWVANRRAPRVTLTVGQTGVHVAEIADRARSTEQSLPATRT
jgi:hypothetical protein